MQALEQRLIALERSNRHLRGLISLSIVGLIAVVAWGAGQPAFTVGDNGSTDVFRARRVEIVDASGAALVVLDATGPAGQISVQDRRGRSLVQIAGEEREGGLAGSAAFLNAEAGLKLVSIGANKIGRGEIATHGAGGRSLVSLGGGAIGGMLSTFSDEGKDLVLIGSSRGNGTIRTFSESGEALVNLGVTTRGQGTVATYDADGRPLVQLGATSRDGRAAISLLDGAEARPVVQVFVDDRGQGEFLALSPSGEGRGLTPQGLLPVRPATSLSSAEPD